MLKSFIPVEPDAHFPIQNIPFGAYQTDTGDIHLCSAIGEYIVDLFVLDEQSFFDGPHLRGQAAFQDSTLNFFMSLGKPAWKEARQRIQELLSAENPELKDNESLKDQVFIERDAVQMVLPFQIGDYTDFYSSEQHARNVGSMFRDPENALMPNWKHVPIGYHGRASSVVISGTDLHRPKGQILPDDADSPVFQASQRLDFELEMGFVTGAGNVLGERIPVDEAESHIFGMILLNDWSARDIQKWEYKPLGPFLAKNWATSISPWVISLEALKPFQVPAPEQSPKPLEYLSPQERTTFDIDLEVHLKTPKMDTPSLISSTNYKYLYWTIAQQLAHHTVNGCNVRPGDLYGSGTISGADKSSYGSMLELSWNGTEALTLPSGEQRTFLEDGDEITLTGYAQGKGFRVGFGDVKGKILAAI